MRVLAWLDSPGSPTFRWLDRASRTMDEPVGALIDQSPIGSLSRGVLTFSVTGALSPIRCLVYFARYHDSGWFIVARIVPMLRRSRSKALSGKLVTTLQLITFVALPCPNGSRPVCGSLDSPRSIRLSTTRMRCGRRARREGVALVCVSVRHAVRGGS